MMTSITFSEQLLSELPESTFRSYAAFEAAFVDRFNAHVMDLPSGYRWRDALQLALSRRLVRRTDDGLISVVASDVHQQPADELTSPRTPRTPSSG
jgi:hypothetical protein